MNTCGYCGKETENEKFCNYSCSVSFNNKFKPQNQKKPENLIVPNCVICGNPCKKPTSIVCSYNCSGELKKRKREKKYREIFDLISTDFYSDEFQDLHKIAIKHQLSHATLRRAIKFLGVNRKIKRVHLNTKVKEPVERKKKHQFQLPIGMEPKSLGGIWDVEITVKSHPSKYGFYSTNTIWNT